MGAWEELDREFSAEVDTSGLDDIINECTSDSDFIDIFADAISQATAWKSAIEEGVEQGLDVSGSNLISKIQTNILDTGDHPYSQGILGTSFYMEGNGNSRLIGTSINHIYPMSVEFGAEIYPKTASVLRVHESQLIDWDGEPDEDGFFYFKKATIPARPYVAPAFEETISNIEGEQYGVFRSVCDKMTQATQN